MHAPPDHARPRPSGWGALPRIILVATVLLTIGLRVRLLDLPLERDEGEFALMGRMILEGTPPYAEAYNLKPPGIYLAYAAVMAIFGQSPGGIHAGLLVVNLLAAVFLFLVVRRFRGESSAALSTAVFIALCSMPKALGLSAHATQFLLLPALAGTWLLLDGRLEDKSVSPVRSGWAGFLLGMSALVKQPGIFFVLLGVVWILRQGTRPGTAGAAPAGSRSRWGDLMVFLVGAAAPVLACLAWLAVSGVFGRFWFWVVEYAWKYGSQVGLAEGLDIAWSVGSTVAVPAMLVIAVAIVGLRSLGREGSSGEEKFFVLAFLFASVLATAMGFHFRRHYFVLLLPAVSILFGLGIEWISGRIGRDPRKARLAAPVGALVTALAVAHVFFAGWPVYGARDGNAASRALFGTNPFVESPMIGEKLREMTKEGDRIAVVGSEPQLYFYSGRRPATGYVYTYSIVEEQPLAERMRNEMIAEIERAKPAVFVYVNHPSSWLLRADSDRKIFWWAEDYPYAQGYALVGVVEVISDKETVSLWGYEAARYTPRGENYLTVYKRPE